jgi:hypothetical protein
MILIQIFWDNLQQQKYSNLVYKKINMQEYGGYILLVEENGVPGENQRPAASHWQTLSHNIVSSTPLLSGICTHYVSGDRHWLLW